MLILELGMHHLGASWALAEAKTESVAVTLTSKNDRILATFSIIPVFTDSFKKRINGGLESKVEVLTQLLDREGSIVGSGHRSCKFLYLLWDETLYVSVSDNGAQQPYVDKFKDVAPALAACGKIHNLRVALAGALTLADGYVLQVSTILNPVSEELVRRSRQFVTNPRGSRSGSSKNLLITLAGLFGRRGNTLGDVHELRSFPLRRPVGIELIPSTKQGGEP
ncbi:MAG: hypothetical protein KTR25_14780 [Myxococcales bacterium]|nr:hypothetical protein [Myxococcales bacterium]